MKNLFLIIGVVAAIAGCAEQSEQKYKDKAALEAKAGAEGETAETNRRAQQMEADLARIQNFFEAVKGTFEGTMQTPSGSRFRVRFTISPTIQRYEGTRIRTPDEIAFEINNVSLDVLENTTTISDSSISFGCQYKSLRPTVDSGSFRLSNDCPRSFAVTLVPAGAGLQSAQALEASGKMMASAIRENRGMLAMAMQVEMRSINLPEPVTFTAARVK
ncbi:MAG: hypothetical protein V4760_15545 [Bdellovibrionota bacterium]